MTFNHGATVEPSISYNEQGEEYVSFDNAQVEWSADRNNMLRNFDQHQDELLEYNNFNGEIEHRYGDPARDFMAGGALPPDDVDRLFDLGGGMDNYLAMTAWAESHLPQDYIQGFNALIATNDFEEIESAITGLYNYYLENASGYEYSDEEYLDQDDEVLEADVQFNESVLQHFSPQGYNTMIQWAAANLPQEYIQQYDDAMDGEHGHKSEMIDWLYGVYSQHN